MEDDDGEWTVSLASACAIEHMARVMKDAIVEPVLNFVKEKLDTGNHVDRFVGMIAFGAIIEGPEVENFGNIINQALPGILDIINDKSEKVAHGVAWVYSRLAEHTPTLILQDNNILDQFINNSLNSL